MALRTRALILIWLSAVLLAACATAPAATPLATLAPTDAPQPTVVPSATPQPSVAYTPTPQPEVTTPAWFADTILYEVFVRSFHDTDADGIGDLAGVTAELDYIESLHAGAVWLLPIHPSPSYHGYDVTDYFAVNTEYGTLADMQALVKAAHERGIKIIMDLVVNHTSDQHPYFVEAFANPQSPYSDWYAWSNDAHTAYQTFGGYQSMPKLNHKSPEVVQYVLEIARYWMDLDADGDYADGVDGFRCDVAKEVPLSTWKALKDKMRSLNPDSFLLGEVWDTNARNLTGWYAGAFDALFNFPLYSDLAAGNNASMDSLLAGVQRPDMVPLTLLAENKLFPPGYEMVQMLGNHDTNRVMSEVGGDWTRAQTAATLLLTLPGTPMIYYGEEIGMKGEKGAGHPFWDEYRREPMDWYAAESGEGMATWFKPVNRNNAPDDGISVQEQSGLPGSLLEHYRALAALRVAHPALLRGSLAPVKVAGSQMVLAYTRHAAAAGASPEELFLVALNLGGEATKVSLEMDPAYVGPFVAVDALSGEAWDEGPAGATYAVSLPAKGGVVLQLSRP